MFYTFSFLYFFFFVQFVKFCCEIPMGASHFSVSHALHLNKFMKSLRE